MSNGVVIGSLVDEGSFMDGSSFQVPSLQHAVDDARAAWEYVLQLLLLFVHLPLSLLVTHVGVGACPDRVSAEQDAPGQLQLVLKLLPLPCLRTVFLFLLLPSPLPLPLFVLCFSVVGFFVGVPVGVLHFLVEGVVAVVEVVLRVVAGGVWMLGVGAGLGVGLWVEGVVLVVVVLEFLGGEDVVGLLYFSELVVSVGVDVGVQFLGEAEVGLADVMFGGIGLNLENLIIVFLQIHVFGDGRRLSLVEMAKMKANGQGCSHSDIQIIIRKLTKIQRPHPSATHRAEGRGQGVGVGILVWAVDIINFHAFHEEKDHNGGVTTPAYGFALHRLSEPGPARGGRGAAGAAGCAVAAEGGARVSDIEGEPDLPVVLLRVPPAAAGGGG